MNYEETIIADDATIKTAAVIEICTRLAEEYYRRFHSIRFTAKVIEVDAEPKVIQRSCLALLRSLSSSMEEGSKITEDLSDEQLATHH